jgi:23S rRNA-/tRNA-specific pseudouridylate synthase
MLSNQISKVYLARVKGDFSKACKDNEIKVKNMMYCVSNIDAFWECCDEKDLKFEHRTKAKESETLFKFKFYD